MVSVGYRRAPRGGGDQRRRGAGRAGAAAGARARRRPRRAARAAQAAPAPAPAHDRAARAPPGGARPRRALPPLPPVYRSVCWNNIISRSYQFMAPVKLSLHYTMK